MSNYKRTVKVEDGTMHITYQENGWVRYIVEYDDGAMEEWYEKE